jgi:UDP-N-acetyl-D-mannosaminuronic acid dehydrogenase
MKEFNLKKDKIAVLGMGYVGLPLSLLLARKYKVIGFDVIREKIDSLNRGINTINEPQTDDLLIDRTIRNNIEFTSDSKKLMLAKVKIVTVGTPYDLSTEYIDYSQLESALDLICRNIKNGDIIILKSTVPPGTTNGIVKKRLEEAGFKIPEDIGLAFSPERMVEGQAVNDFITLPKIIGATDIETSTICKEIIGSLGGIVTEVTNAETAEMVKMVDNYSRFVFLGLTNELALISEKVGVDVLELLSAAKRDYPRNAGLLLPGPGVGGSCLNKDPFILKAHMKKLELNLRMVDCANSVNTEMPIHVCNMVENYAGTRKLISIWGVAFKKDTDDTRFTPTFTIRDNLSQKGFETRITDPFVKSEKSNIFADSLASARGSDILLLLTDHSEYNSIDMIKLKSVMNRNPIIIDTRGIFKKEDAVKNGFEYHGLGRL